MKYYTSTTEYNCGIDLHAHQMYVCLMDRQGKKLVHCNVKDNDFDYFLKLIKPYRHSLTAVGFWNALRPWITALEGPVRSRLALDCALARLSPNRCLAGLPSPSCPTEN